jgi:hypothetical protein
LFQGIGAMDFRQTKNGSTFTTSGFRFFLALDIVFPETVLKAPFMSVGIFGMQQALVALIMPVRSDRYDVFTYLIIQALHEF